MKEIYKHAIDCSLAFFIAFFSSVLASNEISLKIIFIAICSAGLIAAIKFRSYINTLICEDPKTEIKEIHTFFF